MPSLELPTGMSMDSLLATWPDEPLPNIAGFDVLEAQSTPAQVRALNNWIEPQQTCSVILKHHGPKGLQRVLQGIARASVKHEIPMRGRVRAVAEFLEL